MINNSITYTNYKTECNVCFDDTDKYVKFCECNIKTCIDCFIKLIKLTDRPLGEIGSGHDTNKSYLKLLLKCPCCRKVSASPFMRSHLERLNIPYKMMVDKMIELNDVITKEIENSEYSDELLDRYESDESESESETEYNFIYNITHRHTEPKIELSHLWNTMITMGLRANFDYC